MTALVMQKLLPRWQACRHALVQALGPALRTWAASPAVWALLATVALAASVLLGQSPTLAEWLGDTDDAVRLISVRGLLAGTPWLDPTLPTIGAPDPLVSHWSRLIDLPIALLIGALTPLIGAAEAELAARALWPSLLFFALLLIVAREAQRQASLGADPRSGLWAAAFVVLLAATSVTAFVQFRPGRVDHHNAQILCAVGGLLLLARSWSEPRAGWAAGTLIGLGLAVGYEAIALVAAGFAIAAAAALWHPRGRGDEVGLGVANAACAATLTLLAAQALTVAPRCWLDIHCDALSLNLVLLAAGCTAGLWAALRHGATVVQRFAITGLGAAAGMLAFGTLEPACLAGPFGQVGADVKALWLVNVSESRSILWLASRHPGPALGSLAFMLAGAVAQVALWRRRPGAATALMAALMCLAAALGCWQLKLIPYASWLAAVSIAVLAAGLPGTASVSAPMVRIAAAVFLSQATLDAVFQAAASPFQAAAPAAGTVDVGDLRQPCYRTAAVQRLAGLPPGLVAAEINLGPYIAALTPHRVVAAPYHRLERAIPAIFAIMRDPPGPAVERLRALGADYVAMCAQPAPGPDARPADEKAAPASLRARLLAGEAVPQLSEVPLGADAPLRVWRLGPAS